MQKKVETRSIEHCVPPDGALEVRNQRGEVVGTAQIRDGVLHGVVLASEFKTPPPIGFSINGTAKRETQ